MMKRNKNIMSPKIILSYMLLSMWSSFYIAWHIAMSFCCISLFVGIISFLTAFAGFNSIWIMVASVRRIVTLSQRTNNILSLLLGMSFYLMGLFILSDFLMFNTTYAALYFTHPIIAVSAIIGIAVLLVLHSYLNSRRILITAYEVTTPKKNIDFSIALVSDLHIDNCGLGLGRMFKIVEKINRLHPDFTVFAGDIIESTPEHFCNKNFASVLKNLNSKQANLAVVGNHEYYGGKIEENIAALEKAGLTVLRDKEMTFGNISIIGRDDKFNRSRSTLPQMLKKTPQNNFILILDHNPIDLDHAVDNKADMQLSGHTHNGQMFPFNLIVKTVFKNGYGYKKIGNTHSIVSSGISTWGPSLRLGTKAEIVYIKIKSED